MTNVVFKPPRNSSIFSEGLKFYLESDRKSCFLRFHRGGPAPETGNNCRFVMTKFYAYWLSESPGQL